MPEKWKDGDLFIAYVENENGKHPKMKHIMKYQPGEESRSLCGKWWLAESCHPGKKKTKAVRVDVETMHFIKGHHCKTCFRRAGIDVD